MLFGATVNGMKVPCFESFPDRPRDRVDRHQALGHLGRELLLRLSLDRGMGDVLIAPEILRVHHRHQGVLLDRFQFRIGEGFGVAAVVVH